MYIYKVNAALSGYVNATERMKQTKEAVESGNAEIGRVGRFQEVRNQNAPQEYYDTKSKAEYAADAASKPNPVQETAKPLPEVLAYAAKFQTDDGMTGYLKRVSGVLPEEDRRTVENLLTQSPAEIRAEIKRISNA